MSHILKPKMKTVQIRKTNLLLWAGALSFVAIFFTSCLKDTQSSTVTKKTYLSVMHLAPWAPATELYFDNTKASSSIASGVVSASYSPLDPAYFAVTFKKASSDSVMASIAAGLYDSLYYYTLLLYNIDSTHAGAIRITDDYSVLSDSKSCFRFFHMSPALGSVDVYLDNNKIMAGRSYADNVSDYYYNQFGSYTGGSYTLYVKKAGADSVITQTNVSLYNGAAYTLYLKGVPNGSGNNVLGVGVLQAN